MIFTANRDNSHMQPERVSHCNGYGECAR